jgi:hypothetical protein
MQYITPRGWLVAGILIGLSIWGLWEISAHLLWTGNGYEWCENLLTCDGESK